jgi:hypothetical protein
MLKYLNKLYFVRKKLWCAMINGHNHAMKHTSRTVQNTTEKTVLTFHTLNFFTFATEGGKEAAWLSGSFR